MEDSPIYTTLNDPDKTVTEHADLLTQLQQMVDSDAYAIRRGTLCKAIDAILKQEELAIYYQQDAQNLSNEIEAMTGLSADDKHYWFDRAWGSFMKMPDDFRSKLSIYQVRELFRIMFVTRPANSPDAPDADLRG